MILVLNEATWDKVMLWEQLHKHHCKCPKLLRFEGKPDHLRFLLFFIMVFN